MKRIEVVAALIVDDRGRVLATKRGYGEMKGGWEFPGGKIEPGETAPMALKREIAEELALTIEVGEKLCIVEWDYTDFHMTMHCFWCRVLKGRLSLIEHEAARWLAKDELWSVDWLPADQQVVKNIERIKAISRTSLKK
ncbi:MAG: (deoxy)nucleoside triphosphate pyrophosphohydrolase [Muribaculaceae bacterium]|nr:(deoxy)nucleoside triphosphate pyrophosphohydrolase [Muribaculaceae bacterium]